MRRILGTTAATAVLIGLTAVPAHASGLTEVGVRWDLDGAVTVFENLPGSVRSDPYALNDNNIAVGDGWLTETYHAVRWDAAGAVTDLGVLPGDVDSSATAINAAGIAIGDSDPDNLSDRHAVRWDADGTLIRLATLPGDEDHSYAAAINDGGTIVGTSGDLGHRKAVAWSADGTISALPVPAGTTDSGAQAITGTGWIYGYSSDSGGHHLLRWSPGGTIADLARPGSWDNQPVAMADDGTIAGYSDDDWDGIPVDTWAERWDPAGTLTKLPRATGSTFAQAKDMNNGHVVAGTAALADAEEKPVLWTANGTYTPLPDRGGRGAAELINDAGVLAGTSDGHAVRWSATHQVTDLGVLPGYTQSDVAALNAHGSVLGSSHSY